MDQNTIALLLQLQPTIGSALTTEQQLFVSQHYQNILPFLQSRAGQDAISTFVELWKVALNPQPKQVTQPIQSDIVTLAQPDPTSPSTHSI